MNKALRLSAAHVFVDNISSPSLATDDQHHLSRVLRLRDGESVTCSDGKGSWVQCEWRNDSIEVMGESVAEAPRDAPLTVVIAPVKGDKTDLVIEKLVEIGIDHIVILSPLDYSVVRWANDKIPQVMARYQRIAKAAAMQSRRVFLPTVSGPTPLGDLLGASVGFAEPGGTAHPREVTTLVIGPEGGFSPAELGLASVTVSLGEGILRAETAAIVGAALMVAH